VRQSPTILELSALVALLIAAGLIVYAVSSGGTLRFDQAFLLALRVPGNPTLPIGPAWLSEMARDITALGGVAVLTILTTCNHPVLASARLVSGRARGGLGHKWNDDQQYPEAGVRAPPS
jgi:hypothetical protein